MWVFHVWLLFFYKYVLHFVESFDHEFFLVFLSNGLSSGFLSNASYASIEMIKCFFFLSFC